MQIDKDGWPRFENPISVKATDKVGAHHQHVQIVYVLCTSCADDWPMQAVQAPLHAAEGSMRTCIACAGLTLGKERACPRPWSARSAVTGFKRTPT